MIILGIILICAGAALYIYGEQLNNNIGMQPESFLTQIRLIPALFM